jgi:hypothetical protein
MNTVALWCDIWDNTFVRTFLEILDEHSLSQHVVGATHVRGHTLDVVIARESSQLLHDRPFIFYPILCNEKEI